ncbi:MAG TPA: DUF4382 domain-containing protein [Terracidiphilus sp.]|jgi:hypothetical protein|nr:DUF4382 domain-containing protein [Terracidiphilus sp.]
MLGRVFLPSILALAVVSLLIAGCTSGMVTNSTTGNSTTPTGASFVIGTDAPMAAVTSFAAQLSAINAYTSNDCSGTGVSLISAQTVDFARYNGLQSLIDMNDVAAGTYNCVSISLGTATLGYLDTTATEPKITTETATLSTATLNYPLTNPMVVATAGAPVGLHMDFDLRKSIQVDSGGNITGDVTPTFTVKAVNNSDKGAYIDEFIAAVVTTDTTANTFTVQGPHGRQFTISVNGQTEWDGGASLSSLNSSSIVQISGSLDRADATIDADEVGLISDTGFYAAGQVTYVTPASGAATSFDLYVRGTLPTGTGVTDGDIATVNLSGTEKFSIYWMHGPLAQFLFNPSALLPGQHVAVGGPATGAANASSLTVKRVMLRDWGFNGTVVPGSESDGNGTFQMQVNGFAGVLIPQKVTVYIAGNCDFRDGFSGISSITDNANVRVVGLLLKDPTSGNPILVGHYVDDLD